MAYDDSEALQPNSTYNLGGYTFELKVQNVHEPGEPDVVSVFAICRNPDGTRETVPMDFPEGTTVESWSVEANETEATVYATIEKPSLPVNEPLVSKVLVNGQVIPSTDGYEHSIESTGPITMARHGASVIFASSEPNQRIRERIWIGSRYVYAWGWIDLQSPFTYSGQTVYYWKGGVGAIGLEYWDWFPQSAEFGDVRYTAWTMVFGGDGGEDEDEEDVLVARFAIDLSEADGGPDGPWDEPGSDGPPNKTLYVTVVGASAGIHDPLVFPTDNKTIKGYGFGGDGGHGGGGGAGASTVIIYEFATSKADEVVQEAITKPPGNGSGGGKGGKGGDGCILIFY